MRHKEESDLELEGRFNCSAGWFRHAIGYSLKHISVYGENKRHGFATLMLLVSALASFQYAWFEYLDERSAFLMAINLVDELSVDLLCSAEQCYFYQDAACVEPRNLSAGDNITIAAADCVWTTRVITNSSFEAKRTALALLTTFGNTTDREYFASVEQETLKFGSLSKTVDETYVPFFESWSVQMFSTFDYYAECAEYHNSTDTVCGAFTLSFDNKVYTITVNDEVSFVIILSAGMLSTVVFWILWKTAMYCFDAGSEIHIWFGPHED